MLLRVLLLYLTNTAFIWKNNVLLLVENSQNLPHRKQKNPENKHMAAATKQ